MTKSIGYGLRALVALILVVDAAACLAGSSQVATDLAMAGIAPVLGVPLGIIMLACAILYAMPSTAFLGAILVTGFVGGAILTHLRLQEYGSPPQVACILMGCAAWGGLWLTDARIRSLLPTAPVR